MLKRQKENPIFSGGLEAKELKRWHLPLFLGVKPERMYFANDTKDDLEPLIEAGKLLQEYSFDMEKLRCYVLIGYKGDTFEKAEKRLKDTLRAGFMTNAMLFKNADGNYVVDDVEKWKRFQRIWFSPVIMWKRLNDKNNKDYIDLGGIN